MQLVIGLVISALGIWLTIQARLGVAPWEVLHIGLAATAGIGVGTASILIGTALVVVVAIAGVRPGVGTVLNVVTIGPFSTCCSHRPGWMAWGMPQSWCGRRSCS